jgi:hypothetical protein
MRKADNVTVSIKRITFAAFGFHFYRTNQHKQHKATSNLIIMSFQPTVKSNEEFLASAMMLFSISEDEAAFDTNYRSSRSLKGGWGNSMTRQSYKCGLSSLGGELPQMRSTTIQHSCCNSGESYGHFVHSQTCRS